MLMSDEVVDKEFSDMSVDDKIVLIMKTVDTMSEEIDRLTTNQEVIVKRFDELIDIIRSHEHSDGSVIVKTKL